MCNFKHINLGLCRIAIFIGKQAIGSISTTTECFRYSLQFFYDISCCFIYRYRICSHMYLSLDQFFTAENIIKGWEFKEEIGLFFCQFILSHTYTETSVYFSHPEKNSSRWHVCIMLNLSSQIDLRNGSCLFQTF